MDKRWILFCITLIIGLCCLYLIVDNSTSVGDAIASVDEVIVTLPPGFTNFQTHDNSVNIENKYGKEKLFFKSTQKGDNASNKYENSLNTWNSDPDILITNNTTMKINNVTAYVICYQNISPEKPIDYMRAYFYDYNSTFLVTMWDFDSYEKAESNLKFLVESLYPDYKKPSD